MSIIGDVTEDSDIKVPKLLEYIEITDPKAAKTGETVRFMHDAKEKDGLFYWLEGKMIQRVTKACRSKRVGYSENYFNVGEIRVISDWGKETKPLPSSVCRNLAPNLAWTILPKQNEGNLPMSPESQDCNENIKDIEIQEGGDSIKAIETEMYRMT